MAGEWEPVTLGSVAEVSTGFPFSSEGYVDDAKAPRLLRGDNIAQGSLRWDGVKRWPSDRIEGLQSYELQTGDVVLAMDRPWIEAGLKYASVRSVDLPCLLVQRVARLRGSSRLDTGFLKYVIGNNSFTEHVVAVQTGTAVPHISGDQIKSFEFRLPPLDEQRRIAHILGTLDNKIELNCRMSETLDAIARALFKSWFVDFEPVRAKAEGRDTGLPRHIADLFPDSFEESELGDIPTGWTYRALGDLVQLIRGRTYKSSLKGLPGPVLLGLGSIGRNGGFREDKLVPYGGDSPPELLLGPGDLFASLKDVTQAADLLGAVARVPPSVHRGRLTQDTVKLTPKVASVSRGIVYRTLLTDAYREYCRGRATGTTNLGLSREDFLAYPVVQPNEPVRQLFDGIALSVDARALFASAEARTARSLRDALLPRLVSGEVRVGGAEKERV